MVASLDGATPYSRRLLSMVKLIASAANLVAATAHRLLDLLMRLPSLLFIASKSSM